VIVVPRNKQEHHAMAEFLRQHALVQPTHDLVCMGWVSEDVLVIVVGINGFLGKVAQIHLAFAPGWHFSPRSMLRAVFQYTFVTAKLEMLLGIVNSKNQRAMRMDAHLGFKELHRLPGMHDDGGDIVLLGMKKSECRYLREPASVEMAIAGSA
jgi:hypothetical protein